MLLYVGVVCFLVFPCGCACLLCHFPFLVLFRGVGVGVVFVLALPCIVLFVLCLGWRVFYCVCYFVLFNCVLCV